MKAADMLEQAAKLTWAMKHADKLVDFQSLLDEEQTAMATLYRGGKGRSEMQRIQRWARALISPEPSPIKPVGAAADVDKALAAAEGAAKAADRAEREEGGRARRSSPHKGADRDRRRTGNDDLRRSSDPEVSDLTELSPQPPAGTRRRKSHSPAGKDTVGKKARRSISGACWDMTEDAEYVFIHTKLDLQAELSRQRISALDLQRSMTIEKKMAYSKAAKSGVEMEPTLAYQIDFAKLLGTGASFNVLGKALAEGARWSAYDRDEGATHESRIDSFTRTTNAALWKETASALESDTELSSVRLIQLQTCVVEKYRARAGDAASELHGASSVRREVVGAMGRQARQVALIWRLLGTRIAKAALAAVEADGAGSRADASVTNKSWQRLLTPFFREHVLQVTQEDVADLVDRPAAGKASPAASGTGGVVIDGGSPSGVPAGRYGSGAAGPSRGASAAAGAPPQRPPAGRPAGTGTPPSTYIPESADIVGPVIGIDKNWMRCRKCNKSGHLGGECPRVFATKYGEAAPGYTAAGDRDMGGGAWSGIDLTPLGKRLWRDYIAKHGLTASSNARHTVDFS